MLQGSPRYNVLGSPLSNVSGSHTLRFHARGPLRVPVLYVLLVIKLSMVHLRFLKKLSLGLESTGLHVPLDAPVLVIGITSECEVRLYHRLLLTVVQPLHDGHRLLQVLGDDFRRTFRACLSQPAPIEIQGGWVQSGHLRITLMYL